MVIYFDNAASTVIRSEILAEATEIFREIYGNPSSLHSVGRESARHLENSRSVIASLINANPDEIIFTSSGTEANNLALLGISHSLKKLTKKNHIISSQIEHASVLECLNRLKTEGFEISYVAPSADGLISPKDIEAQIKPETFLISVMYVNNEIGTIQKIKEISALAKKYNILFHSDCVQAFGKIKIDLQDLNVDMISASSHKINAPKGVGFLYLKRKILGQESKKLISPQILGGHQEFGIRASTENVPLTICFAKAAKLIHDELESNWKKYKKMSDDLIPWMIREIPGCVLHGDLNNRVPNILNFGIKGIDGEALLNFLDSEGIEVSMGSACSSKEIAPSHVIDALPIEKEKKYGVLRISFGPQNTFEEIEIFKKAIKKFFVYRSLF
jgi:cysteine desulfurase